MKRYTHNGKLDFFQLLCLAVIVGAAGWLIYDRLPSTQNVAETAMKDTISQAADEARDMANRVLRGKDPKGGTPDTTGGDSQTDPPASPEDLLALGVGLAHEFSKVGNDVFDDVMGLTIEEEIEVGKKVHEQVGVNSKLLDRAEEIRRLQQLAKPFLKARSRKEIAYHFSILDDDQVNAFAHIGGYVYVTTGLLHAVTDDDELRFVLGHEIAHSDLRHCAKGVTAMVRAEEMAGDFGGIVASVAYRAIAVGYSEDMEFEADLWAYEQMIRAKHSQTEALAGLRLLERHYGDKSNAGEESSHGSVIQQIQDHIRTHPPIRERIARLD